jgi:acyl carrier protein
MKDTLREIWKNVLKLEELPDEDVSFFDLGGNSFSAAQVIAELEDRTGKTADVADFYERETIAQFAELFD